MILTKQSPQNEKFLVCNHYRNTQYIFPRKRTSTTSMTSQLPHLSKEPWDIDLSDLLDVLLAQPDKAARTAEVWLHVHRCQILLEEDFELWAAAIDRESPDLANGKTMVYHIWASERPAAGSVAKYLEQQSDLDINTVYSEYEAYKNQFCDSQRIFQVLARKIADTNKWNELRALLEARLNTPHEQLQETLAMYSSILSEHFLLEYDAKMREMSQCVRKTEKLLWHYEKFEYRLRNAPDDAQIWCEYMSSIGKYVLGPQRCTDLLAVLYRSLEFSTGRDWHQIWQAAFQWLRTADASMDDLTKLAFLYRKAYPDSFLPLRELALAASDYDKVAAVKGVLFRVRDRSPECLHVARALLSTMLYLDISSQGAELAVHVSWEDLADYVHTFGHDMDIMRRCMRLACKNFVAVLSPCIWNFYSRNRCGSGAYKLLLSYVDRTDRESLSAVLGKFDKDLESFDDPAEAFEATEKVCIRISADPRYPPRRNQIESWRRRVEKALQIRSGAHAPLDEGPEPEPKRQKSSSSPASEPAHRNREQFTITITGFDKSVSEKQVWQFLSGYGKPLEVYRTNQPEPMAKVELGSEQEVLACLVRDKKPLDGLPVNVERVFGCTLWMVNYPPTVDLDAVSAYIAQAVGYSPLAVRFPAPNANRERRFCYVDLATPVIAQNAQSKLNKASWDGYVIKAEVSNPALKIRQHALASKYQIHVKNLNFTKSSEASLRKCFVRFGDIDSISMPLNSDHPKSLNSGYAFVTFRSEQAAKNAVAAKTVLLDDRTVQIYALKPKEAHERQTCFSDAHKTVAILELPPNTSLVDIRSFVARVVGPIARMQMLNDGTKALVEFTTVSDAGKAGIALLGAQYGDCTLTVGAKQKFFENENTTSVPMMVSPMMMRRRLRK